MRDANALKPTARSPCRKGETKAKRKVESLSDFEQYSGLQGCLIMIM